MASPGRGNGGPGSPGGSSSAAGANSTWLGPMTFDVESARLAYSRVLLHSGDEKDAFAVNVGDSVEYVAPSSPSAPHGPPRLGVARVCQMWHTPRGRGDRAATVQNYTRLQPPASLDNTGDGELPLQPQQQQQQQQQRRQQPLSRIVLLLDQPHTTTEIPLSSIVKRAEVRVRSDCGACLACFLLATAPGDDDDASWNTATAMPSSPSSASSPTAKTPLSSPAVYVTDSELRDAIKAHNDKARELLNAADGSPSSPSAAANEKLAKLRRVAMEKLTALCSAVYDTQRTCTSCRTQPSSTQFSLPASRSTIPSFVEHLASSLLTSTFALSDIAAKHRQSSAQQQQQQQHQQQQQQQQQPSPAKNQHTPTKFVVDDATAPIDSQSQQHQMDSLQSQHLLPMAPLLISGDGLQQIRRSKGQRRPRTANNNNSIVQDDSTAMMSTGGDDDSSFDEGGGPRAPPNDAQQQPQPQPTPRASVPAQVFTAPSLVAAGIDPRILRVPDVEAARQALAL